MKTKAVYFYQYLPPWRIDVFNEIGKYYDLTIVFFNSECEGFTYDRKLLLSKLKNVNVVFLNNGFNIGSRPIRFGILKELRKYRPEVVFVHEYSVISILLALYRQLKLCEYKLYVTTSDNVAMAETSAGLKLKARNYVLGHADGVILYSEAVKDWYKKRYPNLKFDICPNIQNPDTLLKYRPEFIDIIEGYKNKFGIENNQIILYIGRLAKVKGIDLLLTAFSKVDVGNYKLVIVGEGKERPSLEEQAKKIGISENVVFAGFYSGIELYAWYELANFFILPSRYEPFGAVINEALIYGCPVVASKYIGALDFIDETNGIIFNPLNEDEFIMTLKETMARYNARSSNRDNLMIRSFSDAVKSFCRINM